MNSWRNVQMCEYVNLFVYLFIYLIDWLIGWSMDQLDPLTEEQTRTLVNNTSVTLNFNVS